MIQLTPEQHQALARNGTKPIRVIDSSTNVEYVLLRAAVYDRLENLLSGDMPDTSALVNEAMAEDDANDPYLESYQNYA
jgi:hypothetical protein